MLVHHAQAVERWRRAAESKATRSTAQPYLAGIRRIQAVQDIHQRGFARAVFAQQRVDFAGQQVEIDAGVGRHARKALDDATHPDYWLT